MISMKEILKNTNIESLPNEIQENLIDLLSKLNLLRTKYGKSLKITSGFRTKEDHIKVYIQKGITDLKKIPMGSKHLSGLAVDFSDPNRELQKWILENIPFVEEIGLWFEDFQDTPNWTHVQTVPPKSNKRFFRP